MQTIVVVNGKGGVGKSTCAVLIGLAFGHAQVPVSLEDLDVRQKTTENWATRLKGEEDGFPGLVDFKAGQVARYVIVDTPGNMDFVESPKLPKANLYIIPTSTSALDQTITKETVATIRRKFPDATIRILFNKVTMSGGVATRDARDLGSYAELMGAQAFKNILRQRTCYRYAAVEGWSVLPKDAEDELYKLATEIATLAA